MFFKCIGSVSKRLMPPQSMSSSMRVFSSYQGRRYTPLEAQKLSSAIENKESDKAGESKMADKDQLSVVDGIMQNLAAQNFVSASYSFKMTYSGNLIKEIDELIELGWVVYIPHSCLVNFARANPLTREVRLEELGKPNEAFVKKASQKF